MPEYQPDSNYVILRERWPGRQTSILNRGTTCRNPFNRIFNVNEFALLLFGFSLLLGCDSGTPHTVTEDASQEEIDEYRRLVAESQQEREESYERAMQETFEQADQYAEPAP